MKLICEFCGKEEKEFLQIVFNKWSCRECYSYRGYIERRIKDCNGHRYTCTCHGCCSLQELDYKQDENKNWIKE